MSNPGLGKILVLAICGGLLTACVSTTSQYSPPQLGIEDTQWSDTVSVMVAPAQLSHWWERYADPELDRLMVQASQQNLDLRQAYARLQEARALQASAQAAAAPLGVFNSSLTTTRLSENGQLPLDRIPGLERDLTLYDTGVDASWEMDLFGRLRAMNEAAGARMQASEEDVEAVRLSVLAEVARNYFTLRSVQQELQMREESVVLLNRLLAVSERRVLAGDVAVSDLDRIRLQRDVAAAAVPALHSRIRSASLAIALLLGQTPESELALTEARNLSIEPAPFPVGTRADVLLRRPDVRSAERRLAAAVADVEVSHAEWFPKLVIGGSLGFQAQEPGDIFTGASLMAGLAPAISWRILDGGRVQAQIDASDARREQVALAYERAVLQALSDAERALGNYRYAMDAVTAQQQATDSATRAAQSAARRFELGDIGIAELLDAQQRAKEAQEQGVRQRSNALNEMVSLYKALGGEW